MLVCHVVNNNYCEFMRKLAVKYNNKPCSRRNILSLNIYLFVIFFYQDMRQSLILLKIIRRYLNLECILTPINSTKVEQ